MFCSEFINFRWHSRDAEAYILSRDSELKRIEVEIGLRKKDLALIEAEILEKRNQLCALSDDIPRQDIRERPPSSTGRVDHLDTCPHILILFYFLSFIFRHVLLS